MGMSQPEVKHILAWTTAVVAVVIVAFFLAASFLMGSHPVSLYALSQVHEGALASDVEKLLGVPSDVARSANGEEWTYSGFHWCFVRVRFDASGNVKEVVHDH
jgi:hypothetical protein